MPKPLAPVVKTVKKGKKTIKVTEPAVPVGMEEFEKVFADFARRYSQDPGSARNGGELNWLSPGQTLPEFDNAAYGLRVGEMSKPVLTSVGYHIIYMKDRKQLEPYDSRRTTS